MRSTGERKTEENA
jgi:hypothetical protein